VVLSRWVNVTADRELVCVDATAAAAVWIQTAGVAAGGGGGLGQWDYVAGGGAPAATKITANFALMSSVTAINIADGSGTDNNFSAAFGAVREGDYLVIRDNAGGAAFGSFLVTAAPVDNTTYWTFTVSTGDVSGSFTATNTYDVNIISDGNVVGPASATDNSFAIWDTTSGKLLKNAGANISWSSPTGQIAISGTLRINDQASPGPTKIAGRGFLWVRNDTPNTPMFTDEEGTLHVLSIGGKENVRLASTANIVSLATDLEGGTDSLDGVLLAIGDRVLLKDQSTGAENGIYDITAGAATRALDLPIGALAATISMNVQEGTANADTKWKCTNNTGSDVVNTAALVFLADVNASGTVAQDAALLTERADHVNTPGAGFGEIWLNNDANQELTFTDDQGNDYEIPLFTGLSSSNRIPVYNTAGHLTTSSSLLYADTTDTLQLLGDPEILMQDSATGPTGAANTGYLWVKNTAPTTFIFTDSDDVEHTLNEDSVNQQITLASNALVDVDATEVVIGGGYIDGSSGGTYVWEILGEYNDGGGTGNQDIEIRLYDMGADGAPTAGTLRSVLEITALDTLDRVSLTLLPVASPGTDTDEIHNVARMYEVRAYLDAGGGVDAALISSVEFSEVGGFIGGGVTADGVTLQDAAYFTERADHVNTPAEAKAEIWVRNDATQTLMFTDDAGADFPLPKIGTNASTNRVALWQDANGKIGAETSFTYNTTNDQLKVIGTNPSILMAEGSTAAGTPSAGEGAWWVKNFTPSRPAFTDDAGTEFALVKLGISVGSTANGIVTWANNLQQVQDYQDFKYDGAKLSLEDATAAQLEITESAGSPTPAAGQGAIWVKNDAPNIPMFTDDAAVDHQMTNLTAFQFGGRINAVAGEWRTWDLMSVYSTGASPDELGTAALPSTGANESGWVGLTMPRAGKLVDIAFVWMASTGTQDGICGIYKFAHGEGSASGVEGTLMGTQVTITDETAWATFLEREAGLEETFAAGDTFMFCYQSVAFAGSFQYTGSILVEFTE
jgi:hypothetical protein